MASSVKKYFIFSFFLATTLSTPLQIHARDSHFFNKVSSSSSNDQMSMSPSTVIPQQQDPSFTLETENAHGLSGHLSPSSAGFNGQTSHSAAGGVVPNKKRLPKNYNPVSYVTVAEDNIGESNAAAAGGEVGKEQYYTGPKDSNFPTEDAEFDEKEFTPATAADNYHFTGAVKDSFPENEFSTTAVAGDGNGYYLPNHKSNMPEDRFAEADFINTQQEEETFPTTAGAGEPRFNNFNRRVSGDWVQQQGMSDTRFLENGKYFYDVNTEKHARSPLENAKDYLAGKSRNQFMNNNKNFMENNFQDAEEFPEGENLP